MIYSGIRSPAGCVVRVGNELLAPRLDLCNHSPSGFDWGYEGSGPAQLALAILADFFRAKARKGLAIALAEQRALRLHQAFKRAVVAGFDRESWTLSSDEIAARLAAIDGRGRSAGSRGAADRRARR
jgi:hypothetical protein